MVGLCFMSVGVLLIILCYIIAKRKKRKKEWICSFSYALWVLEFLELSSLSYTILFQEEIKKKWCMMLEQPTNMQQNVIFSALRMHEIITINATTGNTKPFSQHLYYEKWRGNKQETGKRTFTEEAWIMTIPFKARHTRQSSNSYECLSSLRVCNPHSSLMAARSWGETPSFMLLFSPLHVSVPYAFSLRAVCSSPSPQPL